MLLTLTTIAQPTEQAQKAWEAQQNGQIKLAIQYYEEIVKEGYYSKELYNNLGLLYSQQGALGKAIVQWERALRLEAQNQEATHNLAVAQQHIHNPITATPSIAIVQSWRDLQQMQTAQAWGLLFLLLWSVSIGLLGYAWKMGKADWKKQITSKWALGVLLFSVLPLSLGVAQQAQEQERTIAIVIAKKAGLRPYPELSSEEMEVLSEGIRLRMVDEAGEWVKVELPNYMVGWVPKSLIEQV
ncbi:MAG: hypothetical protein ACRBFS_20425 [Aureispira sp.]